MDTTKNILMVSGSPFPPDIRIENEIETLNEEGYAVKVLHTGTDFKIDEVFPLSFNKILNQPHPLNPYALYKIYKLTKKYKPIALHIHDMPFVLQGLIISKLFKIPCIYDRHENWVHYLQAATDLKWYQQPTLKRKIGFFLLRNITCYKLL